MSLAYLLLTIYYLKITTFSYCIFVLLLNIKIESLYLLISLLSVMTRSSAQLSSPYLRALYQGSHVKFTVVVSYWQCVEDLINSGFEPHTFCFRKRYLISATTIYGLSAN